MKDLLVASFAISDFSLVCAIGSTRQEILDSLLSETSGLRYCDIPDLDLPTYIGRVPGIEEVTLTDEFRAFDCRNNRLAEMALRADGFVETIARARSQYGAHRIAVVLGTSTSGVEQSERAYLERPNFEMPLPDWFNYRGTQNIGSLGEYVRQRCGLTGPVQVISTACSSSNKSFAAGARMINVGLCDAALVGGVDTLTRMTLLGFNSLDLLAKAPCRPNDRDRDGISIGEAGGFALLEAVDEKHTHHRLTGYGESVDAFHMSAPDPNGHGATLSMQAALKNSNLAPTQIDYINLHGTATPQNDIIEGRAIHKIFGDGPACSSTKGWTGHTLGAAGIVEAVICLLALDHGFMPGNIKLEHIDPNLCIRIPRNNVETPVRLILSNAFGFGGNNCSIILESVS